MVGNARKFRRFVAQKTAPVELSFGSPTSPSDDIHPRSVGTTRRIALWAFRSESPEGDLLKRFETTTSADNCHVSHLPSLQLGQPRDLLKCLSLEWVKVAHLEAEFLGPAPCPACLEIML